MREEIRGRIFLRSIAAVQRRGDLHATLVSIDQRFRDRRGGKGIGLQMNACPGAVDFLQDRLGALAAGRKINFDVGRGNLAVAAARIIFDLTYDNR